MRRGLGTIVPLLALRLRPEELEIAVCGTTHRRVAYEGIPSTADTKRTRLSASSSGRCWKVYRSKGELCQVYVGRSRLPSHNHKEKWVFRLTSVVGEQSRGQAPGGRACFFQLMLPEYSSDSQMRKRLVTAIDYGLGAMTEK